MSNALNRPTEHPLKPEVKRQGVTLWQIRRALGGRPSESILSRMLAGIDPMPGDIETRIKTVIGQAGAA